MRVVASEEVREYVAAHGGALYVSALRHRCCSGAMTTLDASTKAPADASGYRNLAADGLPLWFRAGGQGEEPEELVIEMKGLRRRHPVAYWNGCAYKI